MFVLNQLVKFLKLLHTETSTNQLASGFTLGMFMGFTPFLTLHSFAYWFLLLILRINIGAAFIAFAFFKMWAYAFDQYFHRIGLHILTEEPSLKGLFTQLFNMPVVPYTRFYNSIVMGTFATSVVVAIPFFFLTKILIIKYRTVVVARVKTTWLWRMWSGSKLYGLYSKYEELRH